MKIIDRHDKCVGIRLWKWGSVFVQLWYCPSGYTIERHSHPEEDIELMYLFGSTTFSREVQRLNKITCVETTKKEHFTPKWYHFGQTFSVKAGTVHWFTVSKWPLLFVNFSKFRNGYKAKSAAQDFQRTH